MEIYREITRDLIRWKNSPDRRPLIVQGARQIGKTWVLKKFGENHYKYVAYFNFDADHELGDEFSRIKQPERLIERLALYSPQPISAGETLLIFDEIQECPDALNSLKYFYEEAPQYHIVAAGSLLGVAINHHKGFPVGKVEFLQMYPISFREYLRCSSPDTVEYIDRLSTIEQLPNIVDSKLKDNYRRYLVCGGMPRAAVASLENRGLEAIEKELNEILISYYMDFSKHTSSNEFPRIAAVWQSLPSQLAKENRKFIYKVVRPGARAREYENALSWLREAGLIYQIFCISKPGLPLSAFDDLNAFKLYMLDVGLLRALAKLPAEIFIKESPAFAEFKGALTENYIVQSILPTLNQVPRYWVSNGTAEVDFVINDGLEIIPVEVKASTNTAGRSLSVYIGKYEPAMAVIFSLKDISISRDKNSSTRILHLPLPLADWLPQFIRLSASVS